MQTTIIGYPRIGAARELKFALESYFRQELSEAELTAVARDLRRQHWQTQQEKGLDLIPVNDFSCYDNLLDLAVLLGIVPERFAALGLSELDTMLAMARGYQGARGDVKALALKKWFNTNYHYLVPEIDDSTQIRLTGSKPFDELAETRVLGINAKPVLIGPFTLLKLARFTGSKCVNSVLADVIQAYREIVRRFGDLAVDWLQLDEPCLVQDLSPDDKALLVQLYRPILATRGTVRVCLQTYFGDLRDCWQDVKELDFDGIGLDFVEGRQSLRLVTEQGFPADKVLFAGVINGKNIWRNPYRRTLGWIAQLQRHSPNLILSTSCSLLHVPYTVQAEKNLPGEQLRHFAFAEEKLGELTDLKAILSAPEPSKHEALIANAQLFRQPRGGDNPAVQKQVAELQACVFTRQPNFAERRAQQQKALQLPLLPTTTIGSFPQTAEVKAQRAAFRRGSIGAAEYEAFIREQIAACIALQEEIGLDVLVHGEFERNDMVEYFGENLSGFLFTQKAWVQSYGTRCVKPPIIWGDIERTRPFTVPWIAYAQSLTAKPVKGMLTGPVTILNWSWPREDLPLADCALQIALAIRAEVLNLEAEGIRIIQVDEAALREKLPLRRSDWQEAYLSWAISAFRLVHSGLKPTTSIHTHMCYSEFSDILTEIDAMDADVITFEASRSDLTLLEALEQAQFRTTVGPGVYDIHSPRVPSVDEIKAALEQMLRYIPADKLWVNPDCGLKTRGNAETAASLRHLTEAAHQVRRDLRAPSAGSTRENTRSNLRENTRPKP